MNSIWNMVRRLALATLVLAGSGAFAQELTGDQKDACGALMCLASGTRPNECTPYIEKYFAITARTMVTTINKRSNFLKLCPASSQTPQMSSLVTAIANGAGRCDAASLNTELAVTHREYEDGPTWTTISDALPSYCSAYDGNGYVNLGDYAPKYLGTPETGGYWVNAGDYAADLVIWNSHPHPPIGDGPQP